MFAIKLKRNPWSDGKSALLFALGAAVVVPVMAIRREESYIELLPTTFLLVIALGYFWSAMWKTKCHDTWAWVALIIAILTIYGVFEIIDVFWSH